MTSPLPGKVRRRSVQAQVAESRSDIRCIQVNCFGGRQSAQCAGSFLTALRTDVEPSFASVRTKYVSGLIVVDTLVLATSPRKTWRRGSDSNRRVMVLQTIPLGHLGTAPLLCPKSMPKNYA
jgi:hypothetical protein